MTQPSLKDIVLRDGSWTFALKIASMGASLAVSIVLARLLDPELLGTYFLILSFVSFAALVAQLGLNLAVVRLLAESLALGQTGLASGYFWSMVRLATIATVLVCLVTILRVGESSLASAFDGIDASVIRAALPVIVTLIIIFTWEGLLSEVLRGFKEIRLAVALRGFLRSLLSLPILLLVLVFKWSLGFHGVLIITALAGALSLAFTARIVWKKVIDLGSRVRVSDLKVLAIAAPLLVTGMAIFFRSQLNIWILGVYGTESDVALYGASARLVVLVPMSLSLVNAVAPPFIAELYAQGRGQQLQRMLRSMAFLAGIPAFLGLILFVVAGESVLTAVYGPYYAQSYGVLVILSLGELVSVWAGSCQQVLMMTGHQSLLMWTMVAFGILNAVLSIVLVEQFGLLGVAAGFAITMAMENVFTVLMTKRKTGIWTPAGEIRASIEVLQRYSKKRLPKFL